ncbi:MAG: DUF1587 domain-containing protein, partial [Planctomycetota bacterium]|nr:DUF1587 domain-containing protein [Planctomycetota bacterium]
MPQTLRPQAVLPALVTLPLWLLLAACGQQAPPAVAGPAPHEVAFREHVQPVLGDYCLGCHGGAEPEGGLSFEAEVDDDVVPGFGELRERTAFYERLTHHLMNGSMPPEGEFQPKPEQRDAVVSWFTDTIAEAWRVAPPNPGRVTMRRLNRVEYRNTVRDLLGVDYDTTKTFPTDDVGYGFDHIGDVLSISPILMEKYLDAAEEIVEQAAPPALTRYEGEEALMVGTARPRGELASLTSQSEIYQQVVIPVAGDYIIRVRVMAQQAGPEKAKVFFRVGRRVMATREVKSPSGTYEEHEVRVHLAGGKRRIAVGFPNDYYQPQH